MLRKALFASLLGLVAAVALMRAQTPSPEITFKVEVNYVEEDVRVVDASGSFVRGLKQEDFQVFEDDRPQKVQTFGIPATHTERTRSTQGFFIQASSTRHL